MDSPQTDVVLQNVVTAQVVKVEAVRPRVGWVGPDGLEEQEHGIAVLDVEAFQHTVLEDIQGDAFAVPREVAMVGQRVQTRAGTASFDFRLAYATN
jgi:hypothetical protein